MFRCIFFIFVNYICCMSFINYDKCIIGVCYFNNLVKRCNVIVYGIYIINNDKFCVVFVFNFF